MSKITRGQRKCVTPGRQDVQGSFDCFPLLGGSIGGNAYLSGATETCPQFDTVVEATNPNEGAITDPKKITLELVDDAVYADSLFDVAADTNRAVAPVHMSTVFGLGGVTALGAAGNAWEICLVGDAPAASGVQVHDDVVAGITYISFEAGVATAANVEAAIGGYGGEVIIDTVDTLGGALTVADDEFAPSLFSGGADQETIEVNTIGDVSNVIIHFEAAASTVAEVEALITALAGADDVIAVQTAGTGANVLATGAPVGGDEMPQTFLHAGQCTNIRGRNYTATRSAVGTYQATLPDAFAGGLVSARAGLQVPGPVAAYTVVGSFVPATGILTISVVDHATGNAVDPADGTSIHFTARMHNLG